MAERRPLLTAPQWRRAVARSLSALKKLSLCEILGAVMAAIAVSQQLLAISYYSGEARDVSERPTPERRLRAAHMVALDQRLARQEPRRVSSACTTAMPGLSPRPSPPPPHLSSSPLPRASKHTGARARRGRR